MKLSKLGFGGQKKQERQREGNSCDLEIPGRLRVAMRTLPQLSLLLLLLRVVFQQEGPSRSHSLRFLFMGASHPDSGLPSFVALGYVDEHLFVYYDHESRKAKPRGPWFQKEEIDKFWMRLTQSLKGWDHMFIVDLWTIMDNHNQGQGSHILQIILGCELLVEENRTRSFWKYGYDGQDYIIFHPETMNWTAVQPEAQATKKEWEMIKIRAKQHRAYLERDCPEQLQRFLETGSEILNKKVPPLVKVTRHINHEGVITLRCQAHNFSPVNIKLSWLWDGKQLNQGIELGDIQPSGDGTFQIWIAVDVPPGEEQRYACQVEHPGLDQPLIMTWEYCPLSVTLAIGITIGIIVSIIITTVGVIFWKKRKVCQED
ncbi:hereditary hemochromatosis protein isoform X1 [Dromiciops gliroides]|uniref:hereditary hemochromatosis protein isoform X1 n=1 Tax=Dromiciops gliroides TaxID=33562 RepID=UPI001CC80CDF|nr:hereditary hemochromatosis protein isoform X1 [Dromiciops gliroides]XP_043856592.1 hereditary hemochromatosis protein isoform X1 [Dromiciops gliroides]